MNNLLSKFQSLPLRQKYAVIFLTLLFVTVVFLPKKKSDSYLNPKDSVLGKIEIEISSVASSIFYRKAITKDNQELPSLKESSWKGEKALLIEWLWDVSTFKDKEWFVGNIKKILSGVSMAPEIATFKYVDLQTYCELSDSYGKSYIARCARFLISVSELKSIDYDNILSKQLSLILDRKAELIFDSGALKQVWFSQ